MSDAQMEDALQGPPKSIEAIVLSSESEELADAAWRRERRAKRTARKHDAAAAPSSTRRNNGADSVRGGVAVRQHTPRTRREARGGAGTGDDAREEPVGVAPGDTGSGLLGFGPGALRKRKRTGAPGSAASGGAALGLPVALIEVKQELADDGGWPTEYQKLRSQPYDKSDYDDLHQHYFTLVDVSGGYRESRTRGGRLRVTERVTRQKLRIQEYPKLQQKVAELHEAKCFADAHAHLRCLRKYEGQAAHASVPRILRAKVDAGDGIAEEIDLTDKQAPLPQSVDADTSWRPTNTPAIKLEFGEEQVSVHDSAESSLENALPRVMSTGGQQGRGRGPLHMKAGVAVLRGMWAEQLRKTGYIAPTRVPTLSKLRPRGCTYPVAPGDVFGGNNELAIRVCAAVEEHAFGLFLFGAKRVQCHPDDSKIRRGAAVCAVHRDCIPLRKNTRNLHFIAVLQGKVDVLIETEVNVTMPPREHPHMQRRVITVGANATLIFHGSRYAHGVTASENCVRVTGWVCQHGKRVLNKGGSVEVRGWTKL